MIHAKQKMKKHLKDTKIIQIKIKDFVGFAEKVFNKW